jgi:hypothetical protein
VLEQREQDNIQTNNEKSALLEKIAQLESAVAMGHSSENKEQH